MKVIKKTGLVPVKDNATGEIFGVSPDTAREQVKAKRYTLVTDIPSEYETFDVEGPDEEDGDNKKAKGKTDDGEDDRVVIPDTWQEDHHLQRIKLAKALYPDFTPTEGKWTAEIADEKIREEVDRRTNAELL